MASAMSPETRPPDNAGPPPLDHEASTRAPRFTSHARRQRERYGARVFRVTIPLTQEQALPGVARDRLVREMVRLNHHHGATRFHVVLDAGADAPDTHLVSAMARSCLAPAPVIGLVLATEARHISAVLLESLRQAVDDRDTTLELPLPPPVDSSGSGSSGGGRDSFAHAAMLAREHSFPVTAVRFVRVPGDDAEQRREDAMLLNRLRVRALRIHPSPQPARAPAAPDQRTPTDDYLAAVADLVEQLEPALQIQGLGPAAAPERAADATGLEFGENFHARLEQTLAARGSRQGCRATP